MKIASKVKVTSERKIPESAYIDRFISIKKNPIKKRESITGQNWMMKKNN